LFEILQNLTLVAAANAAVRGADVSALWPTASVFVFTNRCVFESEHGDIVAETPLQWITQLKDSGLRGVWLHSVPRNTSLPDHIGAAFANGGRRWLVETVGDHTSQLWEGFESHRSANADRPWETSYRQIASNWVSHGSDSVSVLGARDALRAALININRFATQEGVDNFAAFFQSAIQALSAAPPASDPYMNEIMALVKLPIDAQQLYASMRAAWVFGGMGSWNDRVFEGDREAVNLELSSTLFQRICESAVAIANCTFPPTAWP
jgi:hypothetical protein